MTAEIIAEVLGDLQFAAETMGSDLDCSRDGDRIAIRVYDDAGRLGPVVGHLRFEEVPR